MQRCTPRKDDAAAMEGGRGRRGMDTSTRVGHTLDAEKEEEKNGEKRRRRRRENRGEGG